MVTLVKTRRRINSVKTTRKITNAMEMVASVKLWRYWRVMSHSSAFIRSIEEIIVHLQNELPPEDIFNQKRQGRLIVVVNSNIGLCAGYNNDIFRFANGILKPTDRIIPIGLKGKSHYKNLDYQFDDTYTTLNDKINFGEIAKFALSLYEQFYRFNYESIHIVYMDYLASMVYKPTIEQLLPLKKPAQMNTSALLGPVIEPNAQTLLKQILPTYLANKIYHALLVAQVSEQASRRVAMKNATNNATDILDKLQLEYNKARQNAITQEITEVVAGGNN
ncbi:MAG: ATP synthase F1 subunit gamma [Bacilli bacterium]|nr:ATP synthase F1 subunit gamma [Bacilli bacterium]